MANKKAPPKNETFEQQQARLIIEEDEERREIEFIQRAGYLDEFRFDLDQCKFWDTVNGVLYHAQAMNARIPTDDWPTITVPGKKEGSFSLRKVKPSDAAQKFENGLVIDGSTWWPGESQLILNQLVTERGPQYKPGSITYNTYIPADHSRLCPKDNGPDPWVAHVKRLFPIELEHNHFFDYAAHMLQFPEVKVNHGIVISGGQGIGKDTMLLPLRWGVGLWNTAEIGPDNIEDRFNPFVKSVMLVINEVRPHNESHRASSFYNRIKPYCAAPPESLPMEMKQCHIVYVQNVMRVFLTTNDYQTMHIPDEDRRLFVMHSFLPPQWADNDYFKVMFAYFKDGGMDAVVTWLLERDISHFEPGATPPMTEGKRQIMQSTLLTRRGPLAEAFEEMVGEGEPPNVFFLADLKEKLDWGLDEIEKLVQSFKHPSLLHKLQEIGYEIARNPDGKVWKWKKGTGAEVVQFKAALACVKKNVPGNARTELIHDEGRKRVLARVPKPF